MKRFRNACSWDGNEVVPDLILDADGYVVRYTDHLEAVKQARADALRWALEQMTDSAPNAVCSGDAGFDMQCGGIIAERARLRALIEKEIEK